MLPTDLTTRLKGEGLMVVFFRFAFSSTSRRNVSCLTRGKGREMEG